ncbi:LytR/AlgR family response regulator transcription factor [Spirosoma agri]|uniref:LytTR family transcriptional regulator n=1 Tax=Spirosoma agri TaxID=1987381 RepID=A0A6M0IHU3_9BACT|nr:LytTR family DNA-binding domain-containing protein [Spirosoma agri]NEU66593.1 LytTR family transcriptional regulator [Spirosoma agri]
MAPLTHRQHRYARLIAVPVAAFVASHLVFYRHFPYEDRYQFPIAYFLTVSTVMLCCWEVNLRIFTYLDQHIPFHRNPVKRIQQQMLLGGTATMLTFSVVFPLAIRLYSGDWPSLPTVTSGVFVCATIATLINGAYVGLYLIQTIYAEKQQPTVQVNDQLKHLALPPSSVWIVIEAGSRQLRLSPDEIAYVYSSGGMVLLVKTDGQQVTTTYNSFSKLENQLASAFFFQLNRQFIVNLNAIRSVQDDVNQKLMVELVPALHKSHHSEHVIVSRYRRAEFKKWFRQTTVA